MPGRRVDYALLHFGGHDFSCSIRAHDGDPAYQAMKADLMQRYARGSVADVVRSRDVRDARQLLGPLASALNVALEAR